MLICIGRQFGSGGHEIGKMLADQLSVPLYDQKLISSVMEHCGSIDDKEMKKADEKKPNPWIHKICYEGIEKELRGLTTNDIVFSLQSKIILDFARTGEGIFVGRCADDILRKADIARISVFIVAPFSSRVERKMKQLHLSEQEATALVRKMDKQRKNYYDYYTGGEWGKPWNYDICINSYAKNMEDTGAVISRIVKSIKL